MAGISLGIGELAHPLGPQLYKATPTPSAKVRSRAQPKGDISNVLIKSVKAFQDVQSWSYRGGGLKKPFNAAPILYRWRRTKSQEGSTT